MEAIIPVFLICLYIFTVLCLIATKLHLIVAIAPIFVSLNLKLLSVAYIDLFGPVYSRQLEIYVGNQDGLVILLFSYLLFLMPILYFLDRWFTKHRTVISQWSYNGRNSSIRYCYYAILLIIVVAYAQLFASGQIPLFDGIERYDYAKISGPLHRAIFKYNAVIMFFTGSLAVLSFIKTRRINKYSIVVFVAFDMYALLTGHRFAVFLKALEFFAIPFSLIVFRDTFKLRTRVRIKSKIIVMLMYLTVVSGIFSAVGLTNSYLNIRHSPTTSAPLNGSLERLLIQQGELWHASVDRAQIGETKDMDTALKYLFYDPILPGRNTAIQYLMWLSIDKEAIRILNNSQQYAGGFPEIFVEVFGLGWQFIFVLAFGVVVVVPLIWTLQAILGGKIMSCLLGGFIIYAFVLTVYNGLVHQYFVLTFSLKLALFFFLYYSKQLVQGMNSSSEIAKT